MPETYLQAAYKDRERVKGLGARWDAARKQWYVPEGRDLTPFSSWLPTESRTALSTPKESNSTELALPTRGISLSQLLAGVGRAVTEAFRTGEWVRVEVVKADVRRGHIYLELTERSPTGDALAQARAMIWADTANQIVPAFERATGVVLGAGIKLLLRAKPTFSPQYGLSLVIDAIDPDYTLGDLEAKKREIRARLQREGLTELNRSLPAPWDYNAVLVVAPQGAAGLGDFQAEAARLQRWGLCRFVVVHSRFQGEGSAAEVRVALLEGLTSWPGQGIVGVLQKHAQTLRSQSEPNIDDLLGIVTESVQAYKVCRSRVEAVERALEEALKGSDAERQAEPAPAKATGTKSAPDAEDDVPF